MNARSATHCRHSTGLREIESSRWVKFVFLQQLLLLLLLAGGGAGEQCCRGRDARSHGCACSMLTYGRRGEEKSKGIQEGERGTVAFICENK
jgi:hypothetical protein